MKGWVGVVSVCVMGCLNNEPLPPAPEDLRGNVSWLWSYGLEVQPAELKDSVSKLDATFVDVSADAPAKGKLRPLTEADVEGLEMGWEPPLSDARGMYIATLLPCTLEKMEDILKTPNQMDPYPGTYDSYDRSVESDTRWSAETSSKIINARFTYTLKTDFRKATAEKTLFARTYAPNAARFENSTTRLDQNYEMELFVARSEKEMLHVYSVWRDVKIVDLGLSTTDDSMVNAIIDNMLTRDERTKELCRANGG